MKKQIETLEDFARMINKMLISDRDVVLAVGGMTGEGKSTFLTLLQKKYAEVSGTYWDFDRMTWSRKELLNWIDGEEGTKKGQLPEYSSILVDELFSLFYKRNWFDEGQIDAIATLNMCRDRHLFIGGNIPDLWSLDKSFLERIRFYVYIVERGTAWVFQQENNPFSTDKWNTNESKKMFRKRRNPYSLPNFVCELKFGDWDKEEKERYLEIRNNKRLKAIKENKKPKKERYSQIKEQRDLLINELKKRNPKLTQTEIGKLINMDSSSISLILS